MSKIARTNLHNDNAGKRRLLNMAREADAQQQVRNLFEELADYWSMGAPGRAVLTEDDDAFSADHAIKGVTFRGTDVVEG